MQKVLSAVRNCIVLVMNSEIKNPLKRPYPVDLVTNPATQETVDTIKHHSRRRMHVILLMYSGWGYHGMQWCPDFPSIEGELFRALLTCKLIDDKSSAELKRVYFQRASKTDKSVSALGQVCSMTLQEDETVVQKLNNELPECIRILDIFRVTRHFNAQYSCNHRVYDYLIPTFAFCPSFTYPSDDTVAWQYRVKGEKLTEVTSVMNRFTGTHNFFNFTSRRLATDNSCKRYIISIDCLPPFLLGDHEYTVIRIVGQSFMLHQIRKMIGLMLAVVRGHTNQDVFDIAFGERRVDIPKAPGLGLMLNQAAYTRYNEKFKNDGIHKPIDWTQYEAQIEQFKFERVYEHIDKIETEEKTMLDWLQNMGCHTYHYREPSPPVLSDEKREAPCAPGVSNACA